VPIQTQQIDSDVAKSKVRAACASHGCFYFNTVFDSSKYGKTWNATQECLQKMFDFYEGNRQVNGNVVFRGRNTESGSASASGKENSEPKQSLEYQRCNLAVETKDISECDYEFILELWTSFLHDVAKLIQKLLSLPSDILADDDHSNAIDLLRVFRYDPVSSKINNLGSSAHTDWGSITIVHTKLLGLQRCCTSDDHKDNEKWIDVSPIKESKENACNTDISEVSLFIHIGDFMSLANNGRWLSPRHRVICPNLLNTIEPRFSLVYFVYPKRGVTLRHAQNIFNSIEEQESSTPLSNPECIHYSVLQDQQAGRDYIKIASDTFEEYQDVPYDIVMALKWAQVQRSSF
jgi:isopenicillin N synthase-like dioxygenase